MTVKFLTEFFWEANLC